MLKNSVDDLVRRTVATHGNDVPYASGNGLGRQFGSVKFLFRENDVERETHNPERLLQLWPSLTHFAAAGSWIGDETPVVAVSFVLFLPHRGMRIAMFEALKS